MQINFKNYSYGVILGIIFCVISAVFDVVVSNITQTLNPAVFIVYCFVIASCFFIILSILYVGGNEYLFKIKTNFRILLLTNVAVLLNWGGLIISLKFLEPAIVGIASVACGPVLTIVISKYFIRGISKQQKMEVGISWIILAIVIFMLANSYLGNSGITTTSYTERSIGIFCVILSAIGTVLYTFFSKKLSDTGWKSYEILGARNIIMLLVVFYYCLTQHQDISLAHDQIIIVLLLVIFGHIIPIFIIQNVIMRLDPIHVSLLLLLLPVFTLFIQFIDKRIIISLDSIMSVLSITFLLIILTISKFKRNDNIMKNMDELED